jgi:hypothetical protein
LAAAPDHLDKGDRIMKKWTAVQYDISKKLLAEVKPQRVKIEQGMNLYLVIELEDEAYNKLAKDPTWAHRMQEKANAKVQPVLERVKKAVEEADKKALKFNPKTAEIFAKDLNQLVKGQLDNAARDMASEIDRYFEEYKKGQKELTKFRIKSTGKIVLNAIVITGSVAVTAATHGAFAPAGIVAIVRGGLVITQECAKLATTADQIAKLIQAELLILKKIMIEDLEKATKAGKITQGAKEVGLQLLSAALGVETPNLKNCEDHIKVHKVDIAKLEGQSHDISRLIPKAMDALKDWEKKQPSNFLTKAIVKGKIAAMEKALDSMLNAAHKIGDAVNRANERQEKFEETIEAMKKGLPTWLGYVQTATTLVIDVGLAIGGAASVLEGALAVIQTAEVDIGSAVIDEM